MVGPNEKDDRMTVIKHVYYVDVGDLPPKDAMTFIETIRTRMQAEPDPFFPKGKVLFVPIRGETRIEQLLVESY